MKKLSTLLLTLLFANVTSATTYMVTNTNTTGIGSFDAEFSSARDNDTVRISKDLLGNGNKYINLNRTLTAYYDVHIIGAFNDNDTIFISSNYDVFDFISDPKFSIDSLAFRNITGSVIKNFINNDLNIKNCVFDNITPNTSGYPAIYSLGSGTNFYSANITIESSTFSNNSGWTGGSRGGAIHIKWGGGRLNTNNSSVLTISKCTFNNNISTGGTILFNSLTNTTSSEYNIIKVSTSTFYNNTAHNVNNNMTGSAIYSFNSSKTLLDIEYCSFINNTSDIGGAIFYRPDGSPSSVNKIKVKSNLFSLNSGDIDDSRINYLWMTNNGYNIYGDATVVGSVSTDQLGVSANDINLGLLQHNGGATKTAAPGVGSFAIDAGYSSSSPEPQNGPILGSKRDVGAAEYRKCSFNINETLSGCDSIMYNNKTYYTSGLYHDTIFNTTCDTIISLNLTINNASFYSLHQTICENDSLFFNNLYLKTTGTYKDTLTNARGCDSIVTLNLTVNNISNHYIYDTICTNDSILFNNEYVKTPGTYYDTLLNNNGCDSIITLHLENKNCNSTSINEKENEISLNIYPNPSNGIVNISTNNKENLNMEIYSLGGKRVFYFIAYGNQNNRINLSTLEKGIYLLRTENSNLGVKKLIIK